MKKIILILVLIGLAVAGVSLVKKRKQEVAAAPTAVPLSYTVRTVLPTAKTIASSRTFLARLEAGNSAAVASKLSGQIEQLLVTENQPVKQGELLVKIDAREVKASIAALKSKLGAAKQQRDYNKQLLQRDTELLKVGGISQEKYDAVALAYTTAAAAVAEIEDNLRGLNHQLGYFNLRAPISGVVGTIFQRQGDLATPGRPILTVNSISQKLTFSFSPDSSAVQKGETITIDGAAAGRVRKIYDDAKNGLSVAEGKLDHHIDRPNGSYLTIGVAGRKVQGCAVPLEALLHRKSGVSVMVYKDGHFVETPVRIELQNRRDALIDPCPSTPVAVAAEAKLSLLPGYANLKVTTGQSHE